MSVIEEVKQKTDIIDVIGQHVSLKKAGRNLTGLCPFHSEKNPSFFVYPEQQSWHCFGCNIGGDVLSFVMRRDSTDFGEALRLLAERAGVTIPSRFDREEGKEERERLYQINETAAGYFHEILLTSPAAEKARNYVDSRQFSASTVNDFQLGFSPNSWDSLKQHLMERDYTETEQLNSGLLVTTEDGKSHDRFRNKLMFPILDVRGHVIGFGARVLDDSLPKYVNSPQTPVFDKSGSLYGLNMAAPAIRKQETAVIVEGYIDVITAHQNGFKNVVASMGTSVTEKQVTALKKLNRNLVLALDADVAGKEAMLRGVSYENILEAEVKVAILPADKDPDDVIKDNPESWQQLLSTALPIMDYTFSMVTAELDLSTAGGKSLAAEKLLPVLAEIKDNVRRAHYLQKLARTIDVSLPSIEAELSRIRPKPQSHRATAPKQAITPRTPRSILSSRLEEDCLALLLRHPELKRNETNLIAEYFKNSENREIFTVWLRADDLDTVKAELDAAIQEHLNSIVQRDMPPNQVEQRYLEYMRRLKERYLKGLEAKRADSFAYEVESKGSGADLSRLEEEGIEPSIQLKEIYTQKSQRH